MGNQQNQDQEGKEGKKEVVEKRRNGLMKGKNRVLLWSVALILGAALALTIGGIYGVGALNAGQTVLFSENVEGGVTAPTTPNVDVTTSEGTWTAVGVGSDTGWHVTKKNAWSGNQSFYVGNDATKTYATVTASTWTLTSPLINVPDNVRDSGTTAIMFSFQHWMHGELNAPSNDYGVVQVSGNGTDWTTISRWGSAVPWTYEEFNISTLANTAADSTGDGDSIPDIQVRFVFYCDKDKNNYEGWYVDDIKVAAAKVEQKTACCGSENNLILNFTVPPTSAGDDAVYSPSGQSRAMQGKSIKLFNNITNGTCGNPGDTTWMTVKVGWADTSTPVQFNGNSGSNFYSSIFIDSDGDSVVTRKADNVLVDGSPLLAGMPLVSFKLTELHTDDGTNTQAYDGGSNPEDIVLHDRDDDRMFTYFTNGKETDAFIYKGFRENKNPDEVEGDKLSKFELDVIKQPDAAVDPNGGIVTTVPIYNDTYATYLGSPISLGRWVPAGTTIIIPGDDGTIQTTPNNIGCTVDYNDTAIFDLVLTWGDNTIGTNPGHGDILRSVWNNATDTQYYADRGANGGITNRYDGADTTFGHAPVPYLPLNPTGVLSGLGEVIINNRGDTILEVGVLNGSCTDAVAIPGYADVQSFCANTTTVAGYAYTDNLLRIVDTDTGAAVGSFGVPADNFYGNTEAIWFSPAAADNEIDSRARVIWPGKASVQAFNLSDSIAFSDTDSALAYVNGFDWIVFDVNGNDIYDSGTDIILVAGTSSLANGDALTFFGTSSDSVAYLDTNHDGMYDTVAAYLFEPIIFLRGDVATNGMDVRETYSVLDAADTATIAAAGMDTTAVKYVSLYTGAGGWDENNEWRTLCSMAVQGLAYFDANHNNIFDTAPFEAIYKANNTTYLANAIVDRSDTVITAGAAGLRRMDTQSGWPSGLLTHTDYNGNNIVDSGEQVVVNTTNTVYNYIRESYFENAIVEGPQTTAGCGIITTMLGDRGDSYVVGGVTKGSASTAYPTDLWNWAESVTALLSTGDTIAINTGSTAAGGTYGFINMGTPRQTAYNNGKVLNDDNSQDAVQDGIADNADDVQQQIGDIAYWLDDNSDLQFDAGDLIFMDTNGNGKYDSSSDFVYYPWSGAGIDLAEYDGKPAAKAYKVENIHGQTTLYNSGDTLYAASWAFRDTDDNGRFDLGDDIYQNSIPLSTVDNTTYKIGSGVITVTIQNDDVCILGTAADLGTVLVEFNNTAESFGDLNGNGVYDGNTVDTFTAANDTNGNGVWDPAEYHTDLNGNGDFDCNIDSIVSEYYMASSVPAGYSPRYSSCATELWSPLAGTSGTTNPPAGTPIIFDWNADGVVNTLDAYAGWVDRAATGNINYYDTSEEVWIDYANNVSNGVVDVPGADALKQLTIINDGTAEYSGDVTGFKLYYEEDLYDTGPSGFQLGEDFLISGTYTTSTAKTWVLKLASPFTLNDTYQFYVTAKIASAPVTFRGEILAKIDRSDTGALVSGSSLTGMWYNDLYNVTIDCEAPPKAEVTKMELRNCVNTDWAAIYEWKKGSNPENNVFEVRDRLKLTIQTPTNEDVRMVRVQFKAANTTDTPAVLTDLDSDTPGDANGDGKPGVANVDDDADGGIDLDDLQVRAAYGKVVAGSYLTDRRDNDANGYIDGYEPTVAKGAPADIDVDGDSLYGERCPSAWDDVPHWKGNPNGYRPEYDDDEDGMMDEDEFFLFFVDSSDPADTKAFTSLWLDANKNVVKAGNLAAVKPIPVLPGCWFTTNGKFEWEVNTLIWERVHKLVTAKATTNNLTCSLGNGVRYEIRVTAFDDCCRSSSNTVPIQVVIDNAAPVFVEKPTYKEDVTKPGNYFFEAKIAQGDLRDVWKVEFRVASDSAANVCSLPVWDTVYTAGGDGIFRTTETKEINLTNWPPCGAGKAYVCVTAYDRLGYGELNENGTGLTGDCVSYNAGTCVVGGNSSDTTIEIDAKDEMAPEAWITSIWGQDVLDTFGIRVPQANSIPLEVADWAALDRDLNPRLWGPNVYEDSNESGSTWAQTADGAKYSLEKLYKPMPAGYKYVNIDVNDGPYFNYLVDGGHIYWDANSNNIVDTADTYLASTGAIAVTNDMADTGLFLQPFTYKCLTGVKYADLNRNGVFDTAAGDSEPIFFDTNDIESFKFQYLKEGGSTGWLVLPSLTGYTDDAGNCPIMVNWNTTRLGEGVYKLRVIAKDCEGKSLSNPREVIAIVDNSCVPPHLVGFINSGETLVNEPYDTQVTRIFDTGSTVSGTVQFVASTYANDVKKVEFWYAPCIPTRQVGPANLLFILDNDDSMKAAHINNIKANASSLALGSDMKVGVIPYGDAITKPISTGGKYMVTTQAEFSTLLDQYWDDTTSASCENAFTSVKQAVDLYKSNNYFDSGARIIVVLVTEEDADDDGTAKQAAIDALGASGANVEELFVIYKKNAGFPADGCDFISSNTTSAIEDFGDTYSSSIVFQFNAQGGKAQALSIDANWGTTLNLISQAAQQTAAGWRYLGTGDTPESAKLDKEFIRVWRSSAWNSNRFDNGGGYKIKARIVDDMGNKCSTVSGCFTVHNLCPVVNISNIANLSYIAPKSDNGVDIKYHWMNTAGELEGEPTYDKDGSETINYTAGSGEWLDINGNGLYDQTSAWLEVKLTAAKSAATDTGDILYVEYQYLLDGENTWKTISNDLKDTTRVYTSDSNPTWEMTWYPDYTFRNLRRTLGLQLRARAYTAEGVASTCIGTATHVEIAENIEPIATIMEVKTGNTLVKVNDVDTQRVNVCSGGQAIGLEIAAIAYDQDAAGMAANTTIRELDFYVKAPDSAKWEKKGTITPSLTGSNADEGDTGDWKINWQMTADKPCAEGKYLFAAVATDQAGNKTLVTSEADTSPTENKSYGNVGLDLVSDTVTANPISRVYGDTEPYQDNSAAAPGRWENNNDTDSVYKTIILDCRPPEATIATDALRCFQHTFDFDIAATSAFGAFNINAAGDSYSVVKVWMREKGSVNPWTLIATTEEEVIIDTGDMVISTRPKIGSDDVYADPSYRVGVHVDSGTVIIKPGRDGILQSKPGDTNGDGIPDTTGFTLTVTSGDAISRISGTFSATVSITDTIVDTYAVRVTYPVPGNGIDEDGNSADADQDGYPNGQEITAGTNPSDSTSHPAVATELASKYIDEDGIGGLDPGPGVEKTYEFMVTAIDRKDNFGNPGNDNYTQACYQKKIEVEVDTIRPEARIARIDTQTGLADNIDTAQTVTVTTGEDILITAVVDANPWNAAGKYEFSGSETLVGDVTKVEFFADADGDDIYEILIGLGDNKDHAAHGFSNKYSVRLTKDQLIASFGGANYYNKCYKVIAIAYDDNCSNNREDKLPLNAPNWESEDTENLTLCIEGLCNLALQLGGLGNNGCEPASILADDMDNRVFLSGDAACKKTKISGDEIDLFVQVGQGQADTTSVEISFNGGSTWEKMNYNNFNDFTFTLYEDDFPYYSTANTGQAGAQAKFEDVMVNVKSDTMTDTVSIPMSVWVNADGAHIWQSKDGVLGNMIVDGGDGISHTAPLTGSDDIKVEEVGYLTSIVGADTIALILPGPDGILQSIPGDTDGDGDIDKVTTKDKYLINVPAKTYTGAISTPAIFGRVGQTCRTKVKTGTDDIQVIKAGVTIRTSNTTDADSAVVIMPGPNGVIDSIAGDANGDGYLSTAEVNANLNRDARPADRTAAITYSYDFTIDAVGNDTYDQKSGQFTLPRSPVWSINKDISHLADGVYEIVVRAANTTDSCPDPISKKVIIDRTPPQLGDIKVTLETKCGNMVGAGKEVPIWATVSDPSGDTNINIIGVASVLFQWSKDANTQDGTSMWYDIGSDTDGSKGWSVDWTVPDYLQQGQIVYVRAIAYDDAGNGALLNDGIAVTVDTVAPKAYISKATIGGKVYVSPKIDGLQFTKGEVFTLVAATNDTADIAGVVFEWSMGQASNNVETEIWTVIPAYTYSDTDILSSDGWQVVWHTGETNLPETSDYYVQIRARAIDCAGNMDTAPVVTILLHNDKTTPLAWLTHLDNGCKRRNILDPHLAVTNNSVLYGVTDGDAVMVTVEMSTTNTAPWKELGIATIHQATPGDTFSYAWDAAALVEGVYYLRVKAVDADGNMSTSSHSAKIVVDHTPPEVVSFDVSDTSPNSDDAITFTVKADATMAGSETVAARAVYLQYWDNATAGWLPNPDNNPNSAPLSYSAQDKEWSLTVNDVDALEDALLGGGASFTGCNYYLRVLVEDWACNRNTLDSFGKDISETSVIQMKLDNVDPIIVNVYSGNRTYEGPDTTPVACGGDAVDIYVKVREDECSGIDANNIKFYYRPQSQFGGLEWKAIKGTAVKLEKVLTEGTTGYESLYTAKWTTPLNQSDSNVVYEIGAEVADGAKNDTYSWRGNTVTGIAYVLVECDKTAPTGTTVKAEDCNDSNCKPATFDGMITLTAQTTGHADDYRSISDISVDSDQGKAAVEFYYLEEGGTIWKPLYTDLTTDTLAVSAVAGDKLITLGNGIAGLVAGDKVRIGDEEPVTVTKISTDGRNLTLETGLAGSYDKGCVWVTRVSLAGTPNAGATAWLTGGDSTTGVRTLVATVLSGTFAAGDEILITGGSYSQKVTIEDVNVANTRFVIKSALKPDFSKWANAGNTVSVVKAGSWTLNFDSRLLANGKYKIAAKAIDWAGHKELATAADLLARSIPVTIDNPMVNKIEAPEVAAKVAERGEPVLITAAPYNEEGVAAVQFFYTTKHPACAQISDWTPAIDEDTGDNWDTNMTEGKYAIRWDTSRIPVSAFLNADCDCYTNEVVVYVVGLAWDDDCRNQGWPHDLEDSDIFSRAIARGEGKGYLKLTIEDTTAPKITLTQINYTSQCDVSDTLFLPEEAEDMIIGGVVNITAQSEGAADDLNTGSAYVRFMYRPVGGSWKTIDMDPTHTHGSDTVDTTWRLTNWNTLAPKLNGVYEVGIEAVDVFGNKTVEVYPFKVRIDNEPPTNVALSFKTTKLKKITPAVDGTIELERGNRIVLSAEVDGAERNDVTQAFFSFKSHTDVSDNWDTINNTTVTGTIVTGVNPDLNYPYAITWRTGMTNGHDTLVVGAAYDIRVVVTDRVGCTAEDMVTIRVVDNEANAVISRIITSCGTIGDCESLDSVRISGLVTFVAQVDDDVVRLIWKYRKVNGAGEWITAADEGRTSDTDGYVLANWDVSTLPEGEYEMIVVGTSDLGFTDVNKVSIKFIVDHTVGLQDSSNVFSGIESQYGFADERIILKARVEVEGAGINTIADISTDSATGWYDGVQFGVKLCSSIDTGTSSWAWFDTSAVYDHYNSLSNPPGYNFSLSVSRTDFLNAVARIGVGTNTALNNCCYDFAIKVKDQACNEEYVVLAKGVTVDTLPPKACITAVITGDKEHTGLDARYPVNVTNDSKVEIRLTAFDACTGLKTIQFQISDTFPATDTQPWRDIDVIYPKKGNPITQTITWNTTGLPQGRYWLRVVATDAVGNTGNDIGCAVAVRVTDRMPPVAVICGYDDYQVDTGAGSIANRYLDAIYAVTYCPDVAQVQFQASTDSGAKWTNVGLAAMPLNTDTTQVGTGVAPGRDQYRLWKATWIPENGKTYQLRALPKDRDENRNVDIAPVTEINISASGKVDKSEDVSGVTLGGITVAANLSGITTLQITAPISGDGAPLKTVLVVVEDAQDNIYEEIIQVFRKNGTTEETYVGVTTKDLAAIARNGGKITIYTCGTTEYGQPLGGAVVTSEYTSKSIEVYPVTASLGTNGPVTSEDGKVKVTIPGNYGGTGTTGLLILPTIMPETSAAQKRHITPVGQAYQVVLLNEPTSFTRGYEPRITFNNVVGDNLSVRYWDENLTPIAGWNNDKIARLSHVGSTITFDVTALTLTDIYSVVEIEQTYVSKILFGDNKTDQVTYAGDPAQTIYVRDQFDTITLWVVDGDGVDITDIESVEMTLYVADLNDTIPIANTAGYLDNITVQALNMTNLRIQANNLINRNSPAGLFGLNEGNYNLGVYIRSKTDRKEFTYNQPFVVDMTAPFTVLDGDYYYRPGTDKGVISAIFVDQGCGVDLSNIRLDVWKYLTDLTGTDVPGVNNDGEDQGNIINYQRKVLLKTVLGKNGGLKFQYSDDYTNDGNETNDTWKYLQTTLDYKNHPAWRVSYKYNDGELAEADILEAVFYFGNHTALNNLADKHNEHYNWYHTNWGNVAVAFNETINDNPFGPFQAYYTTGTLRDMLGNTGHCAGIDHLDTPPACADWVVRNYIVEKAGPVIAFDLADTTNLSSRPTICATVTDRASGVASVKVYRDGVSVSGVTTGEMVCYQPAERLADGKHTLTIAAADKIGNETTKSITFTVDNSTPIVTIVSPANGSVTNGLPAIEVTYTDVTGAGINPANVGVTLTVAGGKPRNIVGADSDSLTFTPTEPLAEGSYTLSVTVTDAVGNISTVSSTFTVDVTAPSIAITNPPANGVMVYGAGLVSVAAALSDNEAGVDVRTVTLTLNGVNRTAEATIASDKLTWSGYLPAGDYQIRVSASDKIGNAAAAETNIVVDTTGPVINILPPNTGVIGWTKDVVRVEATMADASAGVDTNTVKVTLDGAAVLARQITIVADRVFIDLVGLIEGPHILAVEVADNVSNIGRAEWAFEVDTEGAVLSITTAKTGNYGSNPATITGAVTVKGAALAALTVTLDGVNVTPQVFKQTIDRAFDEALVDCDEIAAHSNVRCGDLLAFYQSVSAVGALNVNIQTDTLTVNAAPSQASITDLCLTAPCWSERMMLLLGLSANTNDILAASLNIIRLAGISYTTPMLSAGVHTVTITAVDKLGNVTNKSETFDVDGTKPVVRIIAPAAGTFTNARPIFTATFGDKGAGVARVWVTLNGWEDVNSQATIDLEAGTLSFTPSNPLWDGAHTLQVTVIDRADNIATHQVTIQVDNTAPSLTIVSPASEESPQGAPLKKTYVTAGELVIKAAFEDAGSGIDPASVEMTIDGNKVETPTVILTGVTYRPAVGELTVGPHDVTIKVADKQGNTVEATVSFIVGAPELDVIEAYNFPNPFDQTTTIRLKLTKQATVTIKIYDMVGDLVEALPAEERTPGNGGVTDFTWGGTNDNGDQVANGVYFARVVVEDGSKTIVKVIKVAYLR